MSLISLEGVQGSGKTTAAVALAYEQSKEDGRKIISNVHLNLAQFVHFDLAWFLEHIVDHEMEDTIMIFDEAYQTMDSRSHETKLNKLFTYFIVQTRKRGVDAFICTHHLDHIEKRVRRAIDIRGACRYYLEKPCKKCKGEKEHFGSPCNRCKGYGELGFTVVNFLDRRIRKRYSIEIFGPDYWHLFATRERIPIQAKILQGIDTAELI